MCDCWIVGFGGLEFLGLLEFGGNVSEIEKRSSIFQTEVSIVFGFGMPWSHLLANLHTCLAIETPPMVWAYFVQEITDAITI